jgi:hypothetical protein
MILGKHSGLEKILGYFLLGILLIFLAIIVREIFSRQDRPEIVTERVSKVLH